MKINVGAGAFARDGWTNVDHASDWYGPRLAPHVEWDATTGEPLPFGDGVASAVYCSHVIEHLERHQVGNLLAECHRVMRAGAVLRIAVPDAELLYRAACIAPGSWWWWQDPVFRKSDLPLVTPLDRLVHAIATRRCRFVSTVDRMTEVAPLFLAMDREPFLDLLCDGLTYDAARPGDHITWWDEVSVATRLEPHGFKCIYPSRPGQSLCSSMRDIDTTHPVMSCYVEAVR